MKALCHTLPLYRGGVIGCNTSLQEDRPNTRSRVGHKGVLPGRVPGALSQGRRPSGKSTLRATGRQPKRGLRFDFNDRRNDFRRWPLGGRAFPTHTAIDAYTAPKLGETA